MKNKINIVYWWVFLIIYLEMIYKIFILKNFFSFTTLSVLIFCIPLIIIFSFLSSLFNQKINKIITYLISIFLIVLVLAQIVYFKFYSSIFSIFSLTTGGAGQVMEFYTAIIKVILRVWYIFIIVLIPFILFIIFNKHFSYRKFNKKIICKYLVTLMISLFLIIFDIKVDKDYYSLNKLLYKTHSPILTINKTGILNMEIIDLYRYIFKFEEKIKDSELNNTTYDENKYNVINIDFNDLINTEKDKTIKKMHKYFNNVVPSNKNEYTGMFKNKNLIFITAESFDTIGVSKELTPTLYKMLNNSFIFNNYYQPLYPISTYDGEYMNLTSLIPKEGTWSLSQTKDMDMFLSFGNIFKNMNYNTYAFHNYKYDFYDRNLSHKNLGFNYIGCGNGLEKIMNCNNWPNSDYELINSTMPYYLNKDKNFAIYYMTVSGHLDYNFKRNDMSSKNKELVDNLKYSNNVKAYIATQIELDRALELLLNKLKENNLLDDTLIVLTPDHYPYGLSYKELNEVSNIDRSDIFENYHTSLIMYNPNIEKTEINKYVSGIDLIPTIYNLFGINYDSRLLMGSDVFSDKEGMVILSNRSFITDRVKYNSITKKYIKLDDSVDDDYIKKMNDIVNDKFQISSLILDKKYYNKVGEVYENRSK